MLPTGTQLTLTHAEDMFGRTAAEGALIARTLATIGKTEAARAAEAARRAVAALETQAYAAAEEQAHQDTKGSDASRRGGGGGGSGSGGE